MGASVTAQALQIAEDDSTSPAASLRRPFAYFTVYRLAVASVLPVTALVFSEPVGHLVRDRGLFAVVSAIYWIAALGFLLTHRQRWLSFNQLLTVQVVTDILALTLLMRASGGHPSGLAILIVVALAGAGLVGQGRLAMFYAAVATIAILFEQALRVVELGAAAGEFLAVGTTSIGFFATAISARLLAERVIANEQLARQRGTALRSQLQVNEQNIRDMDDGVLVVARGGALRQFNPQAERLLGRALSAGMAVGEVSDELARGLAAAFEGGPLPPESELPVLGGSLRVRVIRATEGGDALIYLEDLSVAQMQARQLKLAALGRLTANIAHEIRNPLAAISHAAELLREEKRSDMQTRLTRIIHDNSRRLDRMVKEILELGRRDRVEPELLAAAGFLATFTDEFCMHESLRREAFVLDVQPDATLCFDRAHLNQVLWNLLGNAVRHCSGADGAIRIVGRARPAERRFDLRIVDDGPGIDPAARAKVFEPFFTTHPQGTGLGLYIARELCDANRASLELLENDPGAHFRILAQSQRT